MAPGGVMERVDCKIRFGCNNYCKFCVQGDKRERFSDKDLQKIKTELAEGRKSGARSLVLTGGEPTLHKKIVKIIEHARSIGYRRIQLQTNGRMFYYEDFCRSVIAAGATEFSPALHGSRPEIHDFLTGAPGSFVQTARGIRNARKLGVNVVTNSVVTKSNMRDLPELAKLLVALGVNQYQFAFVHILGNAAKNKTWLVPRKTVLEPWIKKGLDVGIRAGVNVMTEAIPFCFMSGYEDYVAEQVIPQTMIFDANFKVDEFNAYRKAQGKIHGPRCGECKYCSKCEGPWREYPEMFGWDEFIPVK
jgi:MoaA/NifB/PqqE/SkfB family radical SAM enzyme